MSLLDLWRACICIICAISFFNLLYRFARNHLLWNSKTRDYWYALTMWSFAGMSISLEGLIRRTPFRYSLVFITAAAIVSVIGLRRKGGWGADK